MTIKNKTHMLPFPIIKALRKIGHDIQDARKRRRITLQLMADRANLSRTTVSKIENGDPSTSFGNYASILFILGMMDRLKDIADAQYDLTGRMLEEEKLPQRVRVPKQKKKEN